jgi:hypothetical protein
MQPLVNVYLMDGIAVRLKYQRDRHLVSRQECLDIPGVTGKLDMVSEVPEIGKTLDGCTDVRPEERERINLLLRSSFF